VFQLLKKTTSSDSAVTAEDLKEKKSVSSLEGKNLDFDLRLLFAQEVPWHSPLRAENRAC
jgi:hypothetical protein